MKHKLYAVFMAIMLLTMTTSCFDEHRRDRDVRDTDRHEERRDVGERERY